MAAPAEDRQNCRRELLKGCTETLILSLLAEKSMYGYQLAREIGERSSGYFAIKEGTLYPALHRLERDALVEGQWEGSPNAQARRYYYITDVGTQRLQSLREEWDIFTHAVELVAHPATTLAAAS